MMNLDEITFISSGLSGAEIGFLNAGLELNIKTGGYIKKGFITDDGEHPEYKERYGLDECFGNSKQSRDLLNLEQSDLLVVFLTSNEIDKQPRSLKLIQYARCGKYQAALIEKKNEVMVLNGEDQIMPVVIIWNLNTVSVFQYVPIIKEFLLRYSPQKIMVSGSTAMMDPEIEQNVRLFWVQMFLGLSVFNTTKKQKVNYDESDESNERDERDEREYDSDDSDSDVEDHDADVVL